MSSERSTQMPTSRLRGRPRSRRRPRASRFGAPVELRVGEASPAAKTTASVAGVRAACASTRSWTARGAAGVLVRASFHSTRSWCRSAASSERAAPRGGAPGRGRRSREQRLVLRAKRAIVVASKRSVLYSTQAVQAPRPPRARTSVRSNFAVPLLAGERRQRQLAGRRSPPRRVLQHAHDLEERRAAEVALRLQLLDQLLEGQLLVGVGAERRLAHPRQQLAEGRVARRGRCAAPGC